MAYNDRTIFFFARLKDLPAILLENNLFEYQSTIVSYSILGCNPTDYDKYVKNAKHTIITRDVAIKGAKWWGEIRAEKTDYIDDPETGFKTRGKISLTDDAIACVITAMKTCASLIIDDEIALGTYGFDKNVKQLFENATSIRELNTLYEDFFSIEMPWKQAIEMNRTTSNGKRIFSETRLSITV